MANAKEKHHFILVHGAGHGSWCWYKVKPRLEEAGHRVTVLDLAAAGIDMRSIKDIDTCEEYSKPLMTVLGSSSPCDGHDEKVVLVGHSFGGLSLAMAMDRFPDKISVSVFLTAFMPDTRNPPSFVIDKFVNNMPPDAWMGTKFEPYGPHKTGLSMLFSKDFMKHKLYQLSPREDLELGLTLVRPGSLFTNDLSERKRFSDKGYGSVRRVFVVCKEDKAIPEEHQRWMIQNFPADHVVDMEDTDHMPMMCNPLQLTHHLLDIANKFA
ncbi:PREDICTED: methylesterase 1-like [Tarenaya hassleriana]|uniref:methylesterase 1-like n=1 Tax=Tarenaya hassleriana TaxID=28532 RepID=UPI00053C641E|nr:PREDICTED: methylesterase 1-like [Tarenaya hassleriana]